MRKFLELIQAESRIAGVLGHSLALFVFGHGERNDFGIHIGNPEANDEFSHVWLTLAALSEYLDPGVSTILFSTSCFSGGWAVDPTVNITAMAAAGPTTEALSWYGDSVRRFNGGIYATTVQQLLIKRGPEERLGKENVQFESGWSTPAAEYSYSEWSRSVHESTFRDTDSPASYHDIKFSAQDDNWGQNFTERTGIPLSVYKERWNALKDYGNSQMTSPMTRNPQFKQSGGNPLVPFLLHNSMRGSTSTSTKGEKMPALHSFVRNMARDYLASFPGMDSLGTNSKQGRIREFAFADKNVVVSIERLEFFLHWLMYRLGLLDLSNDFVLRAGIPKPLGLGCRSYDHDLWFPQINQRGWIERYNDLESLLVAAALFPRPCQERSEGVPWISRPIRYIVFALLHAKYDRKTCVEKIDLMHALHEKDLKEALKKAKQAKTVRSRFNTFCATIKSTVRAISPVKRERRPTLD